MKKDKNGGSANELENSMSGWGLVHEKELDNSMDEDYSIKSIRFGTLRKWQSALSVDYDTIVE